MLGHYRIGDKIGEGGMGEVYKARDTRLDRDVAVKILPPAFAADDQRRSRFEREAKAVAALSHPNIMAIHDFGHEDDIAFAVTELLEGEPLSQVLSQGPLPHRKAMEFGRQIANGLAAAHERGIIHRDLKPGNLFISRDGRVKILDFGLARVTGAEGGAEMPTQAPTAAMETTPGVAMGTAGYMSPEQVRGQSVDSRSDIFSLGATLYEMLTGQRAFSGDSAVETMSAILKEDPPELSATGQPLPANLERIVLHCLEKNPEERFQSARDLAFQIGALSSSTASGSQPVSTLEGSFPPRALPWGWIGVATMMGILIGILAMFTLTPPRPRLRATNTTPLTFRQGLVSTARFAGDGQTVIYGASWNGKPFELFSARTGVPGSRPLELGFADLLSVSSTGEMAISMNRHFTYGWEASGILAQASMQGNAPREVLKNVHEADWSPDGASLAVVREVDGRYRIEYPLGNVLYETEGWISGMRVGRHGRHIIFRDHPVRGDNVGSLSLIDLAGKKTSLGRYGSAGVAWSPDGSEIWAKDGATLRAISLTGEARVLRNSDLPSVLLDVSPDGRALLSTSNIRREMAGRAPGEEEQILSWFNWTAARGLSADGRTVLFEEEGLGTPGGYLLYTRGLDGSRPVQIGTGLAVALSPDGEWVLSFRDAFTDPKPELIPTGVGQARQLDWGTLRPSMWAQWLPSGDGILVNGHLEGQANRIFLVDLAGGQLRPITPEGSSRGLPYNTISPDERWLATTSPEKQTVLYPLAGGERTDVPGVEPGEVPIQWTADSRYLYVYALQHLPARIFRVDIETGERELVRELMPADTSGVFKIDIILMTHDAQAYVYSYRRMLSQLYLATSLE